MFTIIDRLVLDKAYKELRHLQQTLPARISLPIEDAADKLREALDTLAVYEREEAR